jgi:hypothetical protein
MGKFADPTAMTLRNTLAQKLIKPVDAIRNIATVLGARPYKIRIVRVRWSTGTRGEGVGEALSAMDLLPTPKMSGLGAVKEIVNPIGLDEAGELEVTQISGTFSENDLRGYDSDGAPPADGDEVFYEIEFPQMDGQPGLKRRFLLSGAPEYLASACQWKITLNRAHDDRARLESPL